MDLNYWNDVTKDKSVYSPRARKLSPNALVGNPKINFIPRLILNFNFLAIVGYITFPTKL